MQRAGTLIKNNLPSLISHTAPTRAERHGSGNGGVHRWLTYAVVLCRVTRGGRDGRPRRTRRRTRCAASATPKSKTVYMRCTIVSSL